jgi:hypothetical protein
MLIRAFSLIAALIVVAMTAAPAWATDPLDPPVEPDESVGFSPVLGSDADLASYLHKARPVIVFADTPDDPAFSEQMRLLAARWEEMAKQDVVVIFDTDPSNPSAVRQRLRPRGFMLVLIDKSGQVALRKPFPWDAREIMRAIDRMPDRREEIRNRKAEGG